MAPPAAAQLQDQRPGPARWRAPRFPLVSWTSPPPPPLHAHLPEQRPRDTDKVSRAGSESASGGGRVCCESLMTLEKARAGNRTCALKFGILVLSENLQHAQSHAAPVRQGLCTLLSSRLFSHPPLPPLSRSPGSAAPSNPIAPQRIESIHRSTVPAPSSQSRPHFSLQALTPVQPSHVPTPRRGTSIVVLGCLLPLSLTQSRDRSARVLSARLELPVLGLEIDLMLVHALQ